MINTSAGDIAYKLINTYPGRPYIIFLHDSLGCITLWRDFPEKLSELTMCNILVYDRQGYGASAPFSMDERNNDYMEIEAVRLNELMELLHIDEAILFGHSDGGSIALIAAAKFNNKILGIITEGAHIFVEDITLEGIREAKALYGKTDLKARLQKYHGSKTDAMFNAWAETWLKPGFRSWNIENFLPHITCPALVIQGDKDEYGSLDQVTGITEGMGGVGESLIIDGVGHTPHKEATDEVLSHSAQFILRIYHS